MRLVAFVGGGVGDDPWGRRTWSGICRFLFGALRAEGVLADACGVRVPPLRRAALLARTFHPDRSVWRKRFYLCAATAEALTAAARDRLRDVPHADALLQIGAFLDLPRASGGGKPCFSYHDGNAAEAGRAGALRGLSAARVESVLDRERDLYHRMTRIFTMSEYLRESFVRDFGVPRERVVVVGAGVNLDELPPQVPARRYDGEEVLFIGIEFARKGGWELLRAFREVTARRPRARLHVVGPRALSIPPELARGVVLHGFLDKGTPAGRARLRELLGRASLLVLPSLYEPFGIAPLEGMAHEIPCIVTDGWALREYVTPGVNGDLVRRGDVDDLADKLVRHLGDPDTLRRWGEAGRRMVVERYTWSQVARRIGDGIAAALSPPRGSAAGADARPSFSQREVRS